MDALEPDEIRFLSQHGISPDDVYDGTRMPKRYWQQEAARQGKILVLGARCRAAGHRLRTRAGHCVQCDPKKIAYERRYSASGYVYIAGSLSARLIKLGTASNINQRERQLRAERYAGLGDWIILYHVKVEEGGRVEGRALSRLHGLKIVRSYIKDGAGQEATEVLKCSFSTAFDALNGALGSGVTSDIWQSRRCRDYEFE